MASRPTLEQIEILVEFLERNPGVAKGLLRTNQAKMETKKKWATLALKLNSLGGVIKDGRGWAKYWAEKKCALKRVCVQHRVSMRQTHGGSADHLPMLSTLDLRLVAVMGGKELAVGDSQIAVVPFAQLSQQVDFTSPPSLASSAEEVHLEKVEAHDPGIRSSTSSIAGPTQDDPMPTPPPYTRSQARPGGSFGPTRRRSTLQMRNIDGDMEQEQIEQCVSEEAVTAQALADMVKNLDRHAAAVENIAVAVSQVANSINEGFTTLANAIKDSAKMLQKK